jgi:hypothetical protein
MKLSCIFSFAICLALGAAVRSQLQQTSERTDGNYIEPRNFASTVVLHLGEEALDATAEAHQALPVLRWSDCVDAQWWQLSSEEGRKVAKGGALEFQRGIRMKW